jgi:hypothetical protein
MKLTFSTLILLLIFYLEGNGQNSKLGNIHILPRLGIQFATIAGHNQWGQQLDDKSILGFRAGADAEIRITNKFFLQPGLHYAVKGSISEKGFYRPDHGVNLRLSYLELPVLVTLKPGIGKQHFCIGIGPYVAMGLTGRQSVDEIGNKPVSFKKSIGLLMANFSDPYEYYRRFDWGGQFIAGLEFSIGLTVQFHTQFGLKNTRPEIDGNEPYPDKWVAKNSATGLSFGYRF